MNNVILVGNLTRDPERIGEGEVKRARFTIAVNKMNDGVDFIPCVVFGKQSDNIMNYCTKGSKVCLEGSINSYSFETEEGNKVSGLNVVARRVMFLNNPKDSNNGERKSKQEERIEEQEILNKTINEDYGEQIKIDESDLPF